MKATLTTTGASLEGTPEEFAAMFRALPAATLSGLRDGLLQAVRDGKAAVRDVSEAASEVLEGRT